MCSPSNGRPLVGAIVTKRKLQEGEHKVRPYIGFGQTRPPIGTLRPAHHAPNHIMATVTLHGNPLETVGNLPAVGDQAPAFELVANDMSTVKLSDSDGKIRIPLGRAFD